MKKVIFSLVIVFCVFHVNAQKKANQDHVSQYKKEAKKAVLTFFEGFHKGDTAIIKKVIDDKMILRTIVEKEGTRKVAETPMHKFLEVIHNRPNTQRWNEQLLLFKIEAERDIAQIWTPYEFYFNDKFSHCGINTFQLYQDGKGWKILSITDTRHKEGCK
ncbi:nuclear transport factor 2 family protein [Aquimarina rhabdastrellae]